MTNYNVEIVDLPTEIYKITKDGEELIRIYTSRVAYGVLEILKEMDTEMEIYKTLWEQMSYYFDDDVESLKDLDHKDFNDLKRLSKGLVD